MLPFSSQEFNLKTDIQYSIQFSIIDSDLEEKQKKEKERKIRE
jgi:hypothetical protein